MAIVTRWQALGLATGAAAATGVAIALSVPAHSATRAAAPVHADLRPAAQVAPSLVDSSVAGNLQKYVGLSLVDASAADASALPANSETTALSKADGYAAGGTLARVSLVRATKAGSDTTASAQLGLRHVNQLAWAVEYTNANEPLLGPADGGPHTRLATLVVLLDPSDGSFISAAYY